VETASEGQESTTTRPRTATTPATGPVTTPPSGSPSTTSPSTPPTGENAAATIYVLHGQPRRLDEVSLETGAVVRQVIPLEGFDDVVNRGDEEWWVKRGPTIACSGSPWEEYHAAGGGGFVFPVSTEAAISPNGQYLAYVRTDAAACGDGATVVVRDLISQREAASPPLVNPYHLTWRPDSDEVAFTAQEDSFATGYETVKAVAVPPEVTAGGVLDVTIKVEPNVLCSYRTPAFTADGRLTYGRLCGTGPAATTTIFEEGPEPLTGIGIDLLLDDPASLTSLTVNQGTGQLAFVADGAAWVVDDEVPRKVMDDAVEVLWPLTVPG
jgi:hypothetical protein